MLTISHALISSIPKCEGASQVGAFRPIILNGYCEIITKGDWHQLLEKIHLI